MHQNPPCRGPGCLWFGLLLIAAAATVVIVISIMADLDSRLDALAASAERDGRTLADIATQHGALERELHSLRSAVAAESVARGHQIAGERTTRRRGLDHLSRELAATCAAVMFAQESGAASDIATAGRILAVADRLRTLETAACRCLPVPTPPVPSKSPPPGAQEK